jgi:glucose/arabinose dehydrogenase
MKNLGWQSKIALSALAGLLLGSTVQAQLVLSPERIITDEIRHTRAMNVADLDNDGDLDVMTASWSESKVAWIENLGNGVFGPTKIISSGETLLAESVFGADLDDDGDNDILGTSRDDNKISWYENLGGGNFSTQQVLTTEVVGPIYAVADYINDDAILDIVVAGLNDNTVSYFPGLGGATYGTRVILSDSSFACRNVHTDDVDGDGDVDVFAASRASRTMSWFENLGDGVFAPEFRLSTDAIDARWITTADVDGDGDKDVMTASREGQKFAWHENLGSGNFGPEIIISTKGDGARGIAPADYDMDGDIDFVGGSEFDDDFGYHENLGGGVFAEEILISSFSNGAWKCRPADMDNDGDMDIIYAPVQEDKVAWWQNRTGESTPDNFQWWELMKGLNKPSTITSRPNGELLVGLSRGQIVRTIPNPTQATPQGKPYETLTVKPDFLDITDRVSGSNGGLTSMVLAPDFELSGVIYAYYVSDSEARLSRFSLGLGVDIVDPASEEILITVPLGSDRNVGRLIFGNDGMLYVAIGDGGLGDNAQDGTSFNGKVLRIDVSSGSSYSIPGDNPFVGNPDYADEIFVIGLRKPGQLEAVSGNTILVPDANVDAQQELNVLRPASAGSSLGWPCRAGTVSLGSGTCDTLLPLLNPNYTYGTDATYEILGGVLYQGDGLGTLKGHLVGVDAGRGDAFAITKSGSSIVETERNNNLRPRLSGLATGTDKEVYAVESVSGRLLKMVKPCNYAGNTFETWDAVAGDAAAMYFNGVWDAQSYKIKLERMSDSDVSIYEIFFQYYVQELSGLLPGETYTWSVQALCADGTPGAKSAVDTFTMPGPRMAEMPAQELVWSTQTDGWQIYGSEDFMLNATVQILDLQGRSRWSGMSTAAQTFVPSEGLASGLYLIELSQGNERETISVFVP